MLFNKKKSNSILTYVVLLFLCVIGTTVDASDYDGASSKENLDGQLTLKDLAKDGNPEAQYEFAQTFSKDSREAFDWYQRSANQGYAPAQTEIANLYRYGSIIKSVEADNFKAAEWYTKAGLQGNVDSQYALGEFYREGYAVRRNREKAKEWFGKACDNGNQSGCDEYRKLNK